MTHNPLSGDGEGRAGLSDWMSLRNDIETMRARASVFQSDITLIRELVELRAFRDAHPLAAELKPESNKRPKSALIRHIEASLVFGEYCDREAARLEEKARLMELDLFDGLARHSDESQALQNDAIGRRAVAMEAAIDAPNPTQPETPDV